MSQCVGFVNEEDTAQCTLDGVSGEMRCLTVMATN